MAHGDYTGTNKALLQQQYAAQQQLAAKSTSLVSQVVAEGRQQEIDLRTDEDIAALERATKTPLDESDEFEVARRNAEIQDLSPAKFQATETLDDITVGKNRHFNLEAGQVYVAPTWVVRHLDEKYLVRH